MPEAVRPLGAHGWEAHHLPDLFSGGREVTARKPSTFGITLALADERPVEPLTMQDYASSSTAPTVAGAKGADYPEKQCTWWASRRVQELTGSAIFYYARAEGEAPRDAKRWPLLHKRAGGTQGKTPRVGAVAVFTGGDFWKYGHVAVVERVHPDETFDVSESNWPLPLTVGHRTRLAPSSVTTFLYP